MFVHTAGLQISSMQLSMLFTPAQVLQTNLAQQQWTVELRQGFSALSRSLEQVSETPGQILVRPGNDEAVHARLAASIFAIFTIFFGQQ